MTAGPAPAQLGTRRVHPAVALLDEKTMATNFVRAFAKACADGIPTRLRQDVQIYRLGQQPHLIDDLAVRRERLGQQLRGAEQQLNNTLRSMEEATNELVRRSLLARSDAHGREIEGIRREIAELDAAPPPSDPPTFETGTEVLLAALANIVRSPRLTLEEHAAFRVIVPHLDMRPTEDGNWEASAIVRVPVDEGVAELGPITWQVPAPSVGPASMRRMRVTASDSRAPSAATLRRVLEVDAGLAPEAARLLSAAPMPELAHVVLHARTGSPVPDSVSEEWREPNFVRHILSYYGAPGPWTGPSLYGRRMPRAQAIVDCAADLGHLTLDGYRQLLPGITPNDIWVFSRSGVTSAEGAVVDKQAGADGTWGVVNRRCHCGRPALIVARAPELPGRLLCECGLAVDARPGSTADGVIFPAAYRQLRVRREHWMRDLRRTAGGQNDPLAEVTPHQARILALMTADPQRPWTHRNLAEAAEIPVPNTRANLSLLRDRGFLSGTGRPAQFLLTDPAMARRACARSWRRQQVEDS